MATKLSPLELAALRERTAKGSTPTLEEVARYVVTIRDSATAALSAAKPKNRLAKPSTKDEDIDGFF